jgi:pilus assembly protein CpaE
MEYRILIMDSRPDVLYQIGYALYRSGYQAVFARSGEEGLIRARADCPDLVVIGPGLTDMTAEEVGETLARNAATAALPTIRMSEEEVKNGQGLPGLTGRIEQLLPAGPLAGGGDPAAMGRVIGCIGARGGVGTTTVALNIAQALVDGGRRVIVAEINAAIGAFAGRLGETPLTNLSLLLPLSPDHIDRQNVAPLLVKHPSGINVLYGPRWADEFREISRGQALALLDVLVGMGDAIVLDLPRRPSRAVRATLSRCNAVVVVLEPEPTCIDAARVTAELVRACGVTGESLKAIVVHRTPEDEGVDLGPIRRQLGLALAGVVPYVPRAGGETSAAASLVDIAGRLADG